jgi:hypothetical protein
MAKQRYGILADGLNRGKDSADAGRAQAFPLTFGGAGN